MQTDHHIERLYYSIGEVADMLGVTPSLIRFWESEFPQLSPKKNHHGNRQFTKKDIELLRSIYQLVKDKGYTLEGAKRTLKRKSSLNENANELQNKLMRIKAELNSISASLTGQ